MTRLTTHQLDIRINTQTICSNLELSIDPGQTWGVLGRNGAGKTTFLHTLAGLREPAGGSIQLDNTSIAQISRKKIAQKLGLLLQQSEESFPASVIEIVLTGRHPHINNWNWESNQDVEIAMQALEQVQLAHMSRRSIDKLSGGERQRVALASLIAQSPDIFLLDEPNSHLDLKYQIHLLNYFFSRCKNNACSLIMSLHDLHLTQRYCDHVLLLFDNGETLSGPCQQLMTQDNLERLYQQAFIEIETEEGKIFLPKTGQTNSA